MDFKFRVATCDIKGLPGLELGDAVIPVATEVIENYEYEVWHRLSDGGVSKTRVEHHGDLMDVTVDGETRAEITAKVAEVSQGIIDGRA